MRVPLLLAALASQLGGCAQSPRSQVVNDPVEIRYSHGGCFGWCPVYTVTLYRDGRGQFVGEQFTSVVGTRIFRPRPGTFRRFAEAVAPLKPANGSIPKHRACNMGDASSETVTWVGGDGAQQSLCIGDHNEIKDVIAARNRVNVAIAMLDLRRFIGDGTAGKPSQPKKVLQSR